jgi:dTMP kinase
MFITFEGCEGSGKSTQIRLLEAYLKNSGRETITTREPGGTELAEKLRRILLEGEGVQDPLTEFLIITSARRDHIKNFIEKHLDDNFTVICDRFFDSSLAIQGFAKGLDIEKMKLINDSALGSFKPDLTFLIDVDPSIAIERIKNHRADVNHYDLNNQEFHKKVRNGFLKLATDDMDGRFHVIDGNKDIQGIHRSVIKILDLRATL